MKACYFIDHLQSQGKVSFTLEHLSDELAINKSACTSILHRLRKQGKIASPKKGYYLILPPHFRERSSLPADFFIDDLMHHLNFDYYIALLSAAIYHGAGHQQPQMLQVMLQHRERNILCGKTHIEFYQNKNLHQVPTDRIKTHTGYINISSAEATMMEAVQYMRQCGGINRVATLIDELAEQVDSAKLISLALASKERFWIHRLGFILEQTGKTALAEDLYQIIEKHGIETIPLTPYDRMQGVARNRKWHIAINATMESDLDDPFATSTTGKNKHPGH